MRITSLHTLYFSATGTTEALTKEISGVLGAFFQLPVQENSFTLPASREPDYLFGPDSLVICAIPTYAGRIPNLLLPFLQKQIHGNAALCIPVVTFGNRNYDDSLIELRNTLEQDGLRTVAGAAFSCEHAFSRLLGAGRPNAADLEQARSFALQVAEKISRLPALPSTPVAVGGQTPVRPYYTPRDRNGTPINILKVKPKTKESCTRCGLCAAICPMGAISSTDYSQVPGICIKCCACEKGCPVGAKFFDDPGYLYHKSELEAQYAAPQPNAFFL